MESGRERQGERERGGCRERFPLIKGKGEQRVESGRERQRERGV